MTRDSTAIPPVELPAEPLEVREVEAAAPATNGAPPASAELPVELLRTPSGEAPEIDPAQLDPDAIKVVLRLHQHGHQAYLVGGCVRDLLLGRRPKDFDIATSAHPGEVRATFRNCRLIGRRFRLAHVYFKGGKIIEVSTFRANPTELEDAPPEPVSPEGALEEGEEPLDTPEEDLLITQDNVFGTAEQDARRRDFTINGLFYDVAQGKVIDYVRGRRDLALRQIRTIGDPEVRMREDPVRILRAVRFACKLDLDIESRTYAAMEGAVEDLPRCAPPRLLEETFRLIRGGVARPALKLLQALDALKLLLPVIDDHLRKGGPEAEEAFWRYAAALDERVREGDPLDDAVLLAALLLPISESVAEPAAPEGGQPRVAEQIEALLAELVRTARLPRRIAERCRILLLLQKYLSGERRRRGPPSGLRAHPLFREALVLFEIQVNATGQHREALETWKAGGAPEPRADAEGPGRRRRRRRRSKRSGSGPAA